MISDQLGKRIVIRTLSGQCSVMTNTMLTPNAAAKFANTSRSAIMRAIANKTLPAQRDNKNRWMISREDLKAWSVFRPQQDRPESDSGRTLSDHDRTVQSELAAVKEALARLEGKSEADAARIADLTADRDAWRSQAERLASEIGPISLWTRLFGR